MATGAAKMMLRCVLEGSLAMYDIEIERMPNHRNCGCALHNLKGVCSSTCSRTRNISFPKKQAWRDSSQSIASPTLLFHPLVTPQKQRRRQWAFVRYVLTQIMEIYTRIEIAKQKETGQESRVSFSINFHISTTPQDNEIMQRNKHRNSSSQLAVTSFKFLRSKKCKGSFSTCFL